MNSTDVTNFYAGYYCGPLRSYEQIGVLSGISPVNGSGHARPRYRHAAAAVGTDIYVFGGTDDTDAIVYHVDKFDTVSETWSTLTQAMVNAYRDVAGLPVFFLFFFPKSPMIEERRYSVCTFLSPD